VRGVDGSGCRRALSSKTVSCGDTREQREDYDLALVETVTDVPEGGDAKARVEEGGNDEGVGDREKRSFVNRGGCWWME
jgi:hypothetical protein